MSYAEMALAQTSERHALDFRLDVVVLPVTDAGRVRSSDWPYRHTKHMVCERAGEELPS